MRNNIMRIFGLNEMLLHTVSLETADAVNKINTFS